MISKSIGPAVHKHQELLVSRRSEDVTCPGSNRRLTNRRGRRDRRDRIRSRRGKEEMEVEVEVEVEQARGGTKAIKTAQLGVEVEWPC